MAAVFLADGESSGFEEVVGYARKYETAEKPARLVNSRRLRVER